MELKKFQVEKKNFTEEEKEKEKEKENKKKKSSQNLKTNIRFT